MAPHRQPASACRGRHVAVGAPAASQPCAFSRVAPLGSCSHCCMPCAKSRTQQQHNLKMHASLLAGIPRCLCSDLSCPECSASQTLLRGNNGRSGPCNPRSAQQHGCSLPCGGEIRENGSEHRLAAIPLQSAPARPGSRSSRASVSATRRTVPIKLSGLSEMESISCSTRNSAKSG